MVVAALALPFLVGWVWQDFLNQHSWIITIVALEISVVSILANALYHRWREFFLLWHRIRSLLVREHTYWKPSFRFALNDSPHDSNDFIRDILEQLQETPIGGEVPLIKHLAINEGEVSYADVVSFTFSYDGISLFVASKMKITVPSYKNKTEATFLGHLVEKIVQITNAVSVHSEVNVFFDKGKNPYYGLFISSIPGDLLRSFDACFAVDEYSGCEVIAHADGITVSGHIVTNTIRVLEDILSFRPLLQR